MEVCRRSSGLLLLLGFALLAATLQGVQGEAELEGPSETECRPFIEKALKELEHGDVAADSSETQDSAEDVPTVEITDDDSSHQVGDGEDDNETDDEQGQGEDNKESGEDVQAAEGNVVEENVVEQKTEPEKSTDKSKEAAVEDKVTEDKDDTSAEQLEKASAEDDKSDEADKGSEKPDDDDSSEPKSGETKDEDSKEDSKEKDDDGEKDGESAEDDDTKEEVDDGKAESQEQADSKEKAESQEQDESQEDKSQEQADAESQEQAESKEDIVAHADEESKEDKDDSKEDAESKEQVDAQESKEQDESEEQQAAAPADDDSTEDAASLDDLAQGEDQDDSKEDDKESKEDDKEGDADQQESDEKTDSKEESKKDGESAEADDGKDSKEGDSEEVKEAGAASKESEEDKQGDSGEDEQKDSDKDDKDGDSKEDEDKDDGKSGESDEKIIEKRETDEGDKESDEKPDDSGESKQAKDDDDSEEDDDKSVEDEAVVEELSADVEIPSELRSREHVEQLLKLDKEHSETESILNKVSEVTLKELKKLYDNAIKPLEVLYKYRDLSNRHFGDAEIFSKPLILFMGPWSGGKSSIINYLTNTEYNDTGLRTGAEPSPAYFNILMYGDEPEVIDGTELAADFTFSGLQKFGQGLEERLKGLKLPIKLLEKVNIVEIPGILEVRKQVSRVFPFNDACQWFIDRADIIFLVYDPSKLDVGPETEAILDQLKGREHQTRIVLNKADQVKPEELMRVQGALIWNISPLMSSPQPPIMYTTSLWSKPFEPWAPVRLLQAQERAFLRDLRSAIEKRIDNKIASARRFAVRVRNHAKMVDCYLTTYYNHKSVFGNRKQVADEIIEHPQNYHIYEGLSTLTNISRYDLPDPDVYKDFFKLNPLYEFQQLSATCTYFRGCPINRLDIAIAYDLPELIGTHKKLVENALTGAAKETTSTPGS